MELFERFYKIGQNDSDDVKMMINVKDLTVEEHKYLSVYMSKLLIESGQILVLTEQGQQFVISVFLSGVAFAGERFGKKK